MNMSPERLALRREKDRERKRLKSLDLSYKKELNSKAKERKAMMDEETLEKMRERDRIRKRKEYKISTAGMLSSVYVHNNLGYRRYQYVY